MRKEGAESTGSFRYWGIKRKTPADAGVDGTPRADYNGHQFDEKRGACPYMSTTNKRSISIWALTWPIMIEMFLQFMLGTADTLMVSRISDDAVAVTGIANQFFNAIIVLFTLVCSGAGILIAQKLGAGQPADARTIAIMSVTVTAALGVAVSVVLALGTKPIVAALQVPDDIRPLAYTYMAVIGGGMAVTALNLSLSTAVRNTGDTRSPMFISLAMNVIHIALNYAFIFGAFGFPQWGLFGVAVSTVISRLFALVLQIRLFRHAFGERIALREFAVFDWPLFRQVLRIGWPLGINGGSWTLSQLVIFSIIASMGAQQLAARTYMNTLESFAFTVGWSLALAVQIRISHLYGAKAYKEAYYSAYKALAAGIVIVLANTALLLLFRHAVMRWFTADPWIVDTAVALLWLNLALQPGKMFNMALGQSLSAIGDSKFVMVTALASMWIVSVGLSYALGIHLQWGLYGIYAAMIADEYIRGIWSLVRWRHHRTKLTLAEGFRDADARRQAVVAADL